MPIGPKGEKRPADPIAQAVAIGKIATGEAEETYVSQARRDAGRKGGTARAGNLDAEERSEGARRAAEARWGKQTQ